VRQAVHAQAGERLELLVEDVLVHDMPRGNGHLPVPQQRVDQRRPGAEHEESRAHQVRVLRAHHVKPLQQRAQARQRVAPPHGVHVGVEHRRARGGALLDGGQQDTRPLRRQLVEARRLVLEPRLCVIVVNVGASHAPIPDAGRRNEAAGEQCPPRIGAHHVHQQAGRQALRPDGGSQVVQPVERKVEHAGVGEGDDCDRRRRQRHRRRERRRLRLRVHPQARLPQLAALGVLPLEVVGVHHQRAAGVALLVEKLHAGGEQLVRQAVHAQAGERLELLVEDVLVHDMPRGNGHLPVPQQRVDQRRPGAEHEESRAHQVRVLRAHHVKPLQQRAQARQRVAPPHGVHVGVEHRRARGGALLDGGQQDTRPLRRQLVEARRLVLVALLAVLLAQS